MKYEIGKQYFVTTVTDYWLGTMVECNGISVTLIDFALVRDTGRFHEFLRNGKTDEMEVEPAPDGVEIEVKYLTIQLWPHKPFREVS